MTTSQNGWPVLASDSTYLHTWTIPAANGPVKARLRRGSAGFVLCHFALWFADTIEPLGAIADDWGYAYRLIRGDTDTWSNHSSGTALDLNATEHPLGATGTYTQAQADAIRARIKVYGGVLRHGIDFSRPDPMHVEVNKSFTTTELMARGMLDSPRGKRVLAANPGQKAVILA